MNPNVCSGNPSPLPFILSPCQASNFTCLLACLLSAVAMMNKLSLAAALVSGVVATPCRPVASYDDSPFEGIQLRPDPYYVDEIENLAIPQLPEDLLPAAEELKQLSTFQWMYVARGRPRNMPFFLTY